MKDLLDIRNEIDGIDRQIVELFENRMMLTTQVAEYKISTGKAVFDKEREVSKLDSVTELAHSEFNSHGVSVWCRFVLESRKVLMSERKSSPATADIWYM